MLRTVLCTVLLSGLALSLGANARTRPALDPLPVADRYLEAYCRFDLEALKPFWNERSVFADPTAAETGAAIPPTRGADAIAAVLRVSTQGLTNVSFRFGERFHSGGFVIAIGRLLYTMPAKMLGRATGDVSFDVRVVTVLRVDGEKIVEHTDYTDLSGWREKIESSGR